MTAIVAGEGLGLLNTSLGLGAHGAVGEASWGRNGERVVVNASTGNLVVQQQDEWLIGVGPDLNLVRTYNSQGGEDYDNGDQWRLGFNRRVYGLNLPVNTTDSTVKRIDDDGLERTYKWNGTAYVSKAGPGTYDKLAWDGSKWTWTDGDTQTSETYEAMVGAGSSGKYRLKTVADTAGKTVTVGYVSGSDLLSTLTTDNSSNGAKTLTIEYVSGTSNIARVVSQGGASPRVTYTYDNNRLYEVTVDLTPGNAADNATDATTLYKTTYAYTSASSRLLASITQSDGSVLAFTYDASNRVKTVTDKRGSDVTRQASYDYDTVAGKTTVTEANGQKAEYSYITAATNNQFLSGITWKTAGGSVLQGVAFVYDSDGNLTSVTDGRGKETIYQYDPAANSNGQPTYERDAQGNVVKRSYGTRGELLKQTVFTGLDTDLNPATDPSGPQATYYVYDSQVHLRFVVSPEGRVTEHRYNAKGQREATLQYTGNRYTASGSSVSESQMTTWRDSTTAPIDKTKTQRTDYTYGSWGALSTQKTYTGVDASGAGVINADTATHSYTYDVRGNLTSIADGRGTTLVYEDTAWALAERKRLGYVNPATNEALKSWTADVPDEQRLSVVQSFELFAKFRTDYTYDGLNRLIQTKDGLGNITRTTYADNLIETETVLADGSIRVTSADAAGRVLYTSTTNSAHVASAYTNYTYDKLNRLRVVLSGGGQSYLLYDDAGRKVADIDAERALTEYVYNGNGQLVRTVRYANKVPSANLGGDGTTLTLAGVKAGLTLDVDNDRYTYSAYDLAGRLVKTVGSAGAVVAYQYDGVGRLQTTTAYANSLDTNQLGALRIATGEILSSAIPTPGASGDDRTTWRFYDNDGLLVGELDADSYYSEHSYDDAGRLTQTMRYANAATGAWTGAKPSIVDSAQTNLYVQRDNTKDLYSAYAYNAQGQLVRSFSAQRYDAGVNKGFVTAYEYDTAGNKAGETRYATEFALSSAAALGSLSLTTNGEDRKTLYSYDSNNRLVRTDSRPDGLVTDYGYDKVGNLVKTVRGLGQSDARITEARYDSAGRVTQELTAEGSRALAAIAAPTQTETDDIWKKYGVRYKYDLAGRLLSTIAPDGSGTTGHKTAFYYDGTGRLTHSINALGEVTQHVYNVFGEETERRRIANRSTATFNGGQSASLGTAISSLYGSADSITSTAYGSWGTQVQITDEEGKLHTRSHDSFGLLYTNTDSISSGSALNRTYTYDARGGLKNVFESGGSSSRYAEAYDYDAFGRVVTTYDKVLATTTASYDKLGRQVEAVDRSGVKRTLTYDAFSRVLKQIDALGNETTYAYDSTNRKLTVTTQAGVQTITETNVYGETTKVTVKQSGGSDLSVTTYTYDQDGRVATVTTAAGTADAATTTHTYDTAGRVWKTQDARGIVTETRYDAASRVIKRVVDTAAGGLALKTEIVYDGKGQAVWTLDPNGVWTRTEFDKKGQVTAVTIDPKQVLDINGTHGATVPWSLGTVANPAAGGGLDIRTEYRYDDRGLALTVAQGVNDQASGPARYTGAQVTRYEYDGLGRRTKEIVDPKRSPVSTGTDDNPAGLNLTTSYTYDGNDNVKSRTDAAGNVTRYVYDKEERLTWQVDATGAVLKNEYDANGRLTRTTAYANRIVLGATTVNGVAKAALGSSVTELQVNERLSLDPTNDQVTRHTYDADGRLVYSVDALNYATKREYDALGNVVTLTRLAATATVSEVANPSGTPAQYKSFTVSVTSNSAADQVTRNYYDAASRLSIGVDALGYAVQYRYDLNGNVTSVRRYATAVARLGTSATIAVVASGGSVPGTGAYVQESAADQIDKAYYDAANRAVFSVDALNYVSRRSYDNLGRVTQVRRYALATNGTVVAGQPQVTADPARDQIDRSYYDAAGRLSFSVDALNYVTQRGYDRNGNVTSVRRYENKLQLADLGTAVKVLAALETAPTDKTWVREAATDRIDKTYYDAAGRATFSVNALNQVTGRVYDTRGNLIELRRYKQASGSVNAAGLPDVTANDADDQRTRTVYDAANRATFDIVAVSGTRQDVVRREYDAFGRVTRQVRYDDQLQGTFSPNVEPKIQATAPDGGASYVVPNSPKDQYTDYTYDRLNRLIDAREAVGQTEETLTRNAYDFAGRLTDTTAAVGKGDIRTHYDYDLAGRLVAQHKAYGTPDVAKTSYVLDAFGQRTETVDARGNELLSSDSEWARAKRKAENKPELVANLTQEADKTALKGLYTTKQQFDLLGRVTKSIDALLGETLTQYDAFGNAIKVTDPNGKSGYFYFNQNNQATWHVDPENYAVQTVYDAFGAVGSIVRYSKRVELYGGATQGGALQPEALGSAPINGVHIYVLIDSSKDQTTNIAHDKLGRQTDITDAEGYLESIQYDEFGNKKVLTAKSATATNLLADRGAYTYSYDLKGRLVEEVLPVSVSQAGTSTLYQVKNRYAYDARGNLLEKIEAYGLQERRTTTYEYDQLDRQTRQLGQTMNVVVIGQADQSFKPTEKRDYDARGNLVQLTAPDGARTLSYWDAQNRKVAEIGPTGTLTVYRYNSGGDVLAQRVYGDALALPALAGGTAPNPVNAYNYRETVYAYDRNNRQTSQTVVGSGRAPAANLAAGSSMASMANVTVLPATATAQTRWTVSGSLSGSVNNTAIAASVDDAGYALAGGHTLTIKQTDGNTGRLVYADSASFDVVAGQAYEASAYLQAQRATGQVTILWYDANNNALPSTTSTSSARNLNGATGAATLDQYDRITVSGKAPATAVRAVLRIQKNATLSGTDSVLRITQPFFGLADGSIQVGEINPATGNFEIRSQDLTSTKGYDKNGNVRWEADARGGTIWHFYDSLGREKLTVDAGRYVVARDFDAVGHVTKETRYAVRLPEDFVLDGGTTLASVSTKIDAISPAADNRVTNLTYDKLGRLKVQTQVVGQDLYKVDADTGALTVDTRGAVTRYDYNGLGQVIKKTEAAGKELTWKYDALGREISRSGASFEDASATPVTVQQKTDTEYNGLGSVRRKIERDGVDTNETGDRITFYEYGDNGLLIKETAAYGSTSASAVSYDYDATGRVTRRRQDRLDAAQGGAQLTYNDKTEYSYDLAGQQVQQAVYSKKSNESWGSALQTVEAQYDAYGGVIRKGTNGGWEEFAEYDGAGRVVATNHDGGARKYQVYDAAGNMTLVVDQVSGGTSLRGLMSGSGYTARYVASTFDARNQLANTYRLGVAEASASGIRWMVSEAAPGLSVAVGSVVAPATGGSEIVLAGSILSSGLGSAFTANFQNDPEHGRQLAFGGFLPWLRGMAQYYITVEDAVSGQVLRRLDFPGGPGVSYGAEENVQVPTYGVDVAWTILRGGVDNLPASVTSVRYKIGAVIGEAETIMWSAQLAFGAGDYLNFVEEMTIVGQPLSADRVQFFYRDQGSTSGYKKIEMALGNTVYGKNAGGNFTFKLPQVDLANPPKEFFYLTLDAQGSVVNLQEGVITRSLVGNSQTNYQSLATQIAPQPSGTNPVFVDTSGFLNLTGLGSTSQTAQIRFRATGSSAWSTPSALTSVQASGTTVPGWFKFDPSAAGYNLGAAGTAYEYIVTTFDSASKVVSKVTGSSTVGNVSPPRYAKYSDLQTTVHFQNLPQSAVSARVLYRTTGSGAAMTPMALDYLSPGSFDWDTFFAGIATNASSTYPLDYEIQAFDAAGRLVHDTSGQLKVGAGRDAMPATAATVSAGSTLKFKPPISVAFTSFKVYYRAVGSTGAYQELPALANDANGLYCFNASALSAVAGTTGEWDYYVVVTNGGSAVSYAGQPTQTYPARLNLATRPAAQQTLLGFSNTGITGQRSQVVNAFGEVVWQADEMANERIRLRGIELGHALTSQEADEYGTTLKYNALGKLIEKLEPKVRVVADTGVGTNERPKTQYFYDLQGRLVGTKDANGYGSTRLLGTGYDGQELVFKEFQMLKAPANGSTVVGTKAAGTSSRYDRFGDLRASINEMGARIDYDYDEQHRVKKVWHAQRAADGQDYGGQRGWDEYDYDVAGNRIRHRTTPDNVAVYTDLTFYDGLARVTETRTPYGRSTRYAYAWDTTHLGVGGVAVGAWKKTTTTALTDAILGMTFTPNRMVDYTDVFGHLLAHEDLSQRVFTYQYNLAGQLVAQTGNKTQSISYAYYGDGQLKSIIDNTVGTQTLYKYDKGGNKTFEGYATKAGTAWNFYQLATIQHDALNRVTSIVDPLYKIEYEYDAVGNRRHLKGYKGSTLDQDYWYAYDWKNRFTVTMGKLNGTTIEAGTSGDGVALGYYLDGNRASATYARNGSVETYTYTAEGFLRDVKINNVWASGRRSDLLGRVQYYDDSANTHRQFWYDQDGKVTQDVTDGVTTTYTLYSDGTVNSTFAKNYNDSKATEVRTSYGYDWWDSAKQEGIVEQAYNKQLKRSQNSNWKPGTSYLTYDVNGNLESAEDVNGGRKLIYVNNAQGLILRRDEFTGTAAYKYQNYFYIDGARVGETGNDPGSSRIDYAQALAVPKGQTRWERNANWRPLDGDNFDQNYQAINTGYPGFTSSGYTVRADGESLESIALAVWGDRTLWYVIAEANGMSNSTATKKDQQLVIPNKVTNIHNNSGTRSVYNAAEAIGDISPTIPNPPPPPPARRDSCGEILRIVVLVVAIVVTQGVASAILGPAGVAGASTWGAMGAYAVGGAAGSIASQAVAVAGGIQEDISWKSVALAAIGSGIGAGVAKIPGLESIGSWQTAALRAGVGSIATQGIAVLTGLQEKFSWTGVAAAAAGGAASYGIGLAFGDDGINPWSGSVGDNIARGIVTGFAKGTVSAAVFNQAPNWSAIAIDSFGSALGDVVAGSLVRSGGTNAKQPVSRPLTQAEIDYFLEESDVPPSPAGNTNFSRDRVIRALSDPFSPRPPAAVLAAAGMAPAADGMCFASDYVTGSAADARPRTVRAGDYGGSLERVARDQLGPNASQRKINNYVGQLFEINSIKNARAIGADRMLELPGIGTPTATVGLGLYGKDIALGERIKAEARYQASAVRWPTTFYETDVFLPGSFTFGSGFGSYEDAQAFQQAEQVRTPSLPERPGMASSLLLRFLGGSSVTYLRRDLAPQQMNQIAGIQQLSTNMLGGAAALQMAAPAIAFGGEALVLETVGVGRFLAQGARAVAADVQLFGASAGGLTATYMANSSYVNTVGILGAEIGGWASIGGVAPGSSLPVNIGALESAASRMSTSYLPRGTAVRELQVVASRGLSLKPYSGDVYSAEFVGPVNWQNFYRGDSTRRASFVSSVAEEQGVSASRFDYLNRESNGLLDDLFDYHGNVGSQGLPTIGVSTDRAVAEYFARGPKGNQAGFVTEFKMQRHEFESLAKRNYENRRDVFDINPNIGKQEQEWLFNSFIPNSAVVKQWQVN